ncbi:MAG TPA: type I 3-dehydroquinate dehydratase [Methanosarcinales archaeon]|nr:type I 3-dehydroquinate dehydratase [Methanosarcinales archaeon]
MTEIVAAIAADPVRNAIRAQSDGADMIEIRIDLLDHPSVTQRSPEMLCSLFEELRRSVGIPIIATNRMSTEGGGFTGTEEERIRILLSVLDMVDAVDIELCAEPEFRDMVVQSVKTAKKRVIISYHDFSATPEMVEMQKIISDCFDAGADVAKLAATPHSYADALRLLRLTLENRSKQVCIIGMGEYGAHTRVIAPLYGSVIAYASIGDATAPGQFSVSELTGMLRMLSVRGHTKQS